MDYAGPVQGKMYLVLIDAHSKWIEAFCTPTATSAAVIEELRPLFAKFGIPETVVTDNGTCFVSAEFENFLASNGIRHITSAPYHPATNGLAERAVQIVKRGLKKSSEGSVKSRLAKFLFTYRLTPHTTTGVSPAEMLLERRSRSRLDILRPLTAERGMYSLKVITLSYGPHIWSYGGKAYTLQDHRTIYVGCMVWLRLWKKWQSNCTMHIKTLLIVGKNL